MPPPGGGNNPSKRPLPSASTLPSASSLTRNNAGSPSSTTSMRLLATLFEAR